MWMVGYNIEGGEFKNIMPDHAFNNGRKLRPLVPRPLTSTTSPISTTDFFSHYHHNLVGEQGKRDIPAVASSSSVVVSTRWNPTAEQLRALEELYRRGTRTPSAEQIQHITAQLRRFGKIEGKNVFYWFQNHKARERQKRRRQMEQMDESSPPPPHHDLEKKDSGGSRTVYEVEQTSGKNVWAHSTNCSTDEEYVSIQRASSCTKEGGDIIIQQEEQQRRNFTERNATWQMMMIQSSSSCPPTSAASSTTAASTTSIAAAATATVIMDPTTKLINNKNHLSFFNASFHTQNNIGVREEDNDDSNNINCVEESQTLQLFPLRSGGGDHNNINHHKDISTVSSMTTPSQFFEFLPLKN